jgi:hypothetical protein
MSDKSAFNKWSDLFCRTTDREDGTPRFSLKRAKAYLYEYDGYSGGHEELDRTIKLLKEKCIKCDVSGSDSPFNVSSFEYTYHFSDGALRSTRATTSSDHLDMVHPSSVSKRFVGCSVNLELSSPAGSKIKRQPTLQ